MMLTAIPCSLFRGGTSKGLFFLKQHLPTEPAARNQVLLKLMGSPDDRQIDGLGGAHPLTSKVAIVSASTHPDADVDYLFLQVQVNKPEVSDSQNCGNILAAVAPFALEQGLVAAQHPYTDVRIQMLNTNTFAIARIETPNGKVNYQGEAKIDGVPGSSAPVLLDFQDIAGSSCGALFPTGQAIEQINGIDVTCIDNGMPVVLLPAEQLGLSGDESPATLEANTALKQQLEAIRLIAGQRMNLGDVTALTVPKLSIVSAAKAGGTINTRTFIPHRVHEAIGVLGSVSVATACVLQQTVASRYIQNQFSDGTLTVAVEHPTGEFHVEMEVAGSSSLSHFTVLRSALLRTARLLMQGQAYADLPTDLMNSAN
jgi:4-oxalomesaconate tautomerase